MKRRSAWEIATGVLLVAFGILSLLTFRSYGVSIDEAVSIENGRYFINWYASGFHDHTIITEGNQRLYGSFFNAISAFVSDRSPVGVYETEHLLIAIFSFIGLLCAYLLGKKLGGPMAGFFSALLLLLTPLYYGHSFMNPKDIPFATMFLVSIYSMTAAYDHLPRLGVKWIVLVGVAIGLTLGIRVGALMLFGYLMVLAVLWLITQRSKNPGYGDSKLRCDARSAIVSSIGVGVAAWTVMLIWWPYAQVSPVLNPLRAMRSAANFTDYNAVVLYRGEFVRADSLPWHYLPTWFAITLPEFYAVILLLGASALFVSRSPPVASDPHIQSKLVFLGFSILFPIVYAMVVRPVLYDGTRHFLFVVPLLAVLTGVTLAWFVTRPLSRPLKLAAASVLVALGAITAVDMLRLHPYEYIFFNRTFGGLPAALGRYETDYWGLSHKEGIDWLKSNYKPNAPPRSIRVATTAADFQTSYYLPGDQQSTERFVSVNRRNNPDLILSITRFDAHLKYPGKVIHVVRRMGVPLLYVVELNPSLALH